MENKVTKYILLLFFASFWTFADSEITCANKEFHIRFNIIKKQLVEVTCVKKGRNSNNDWIKLVPILNDSFYDKNIVLHIVSSCKLPVSFSRITSKFPLIVRLDISSNLSSGYLPRNFFDEPTSIIVLNVKNDRLQKLSEKTFRNLEQLERIDLSDNRIEKISTKIFSNNHRLTNFTLNHNKNKLVLDDGIFMNKSELKIVSLTHNAIEIVPKNTFRHCVSLTRIQLDFNKISALDG